MSILYQNYNLHGVKWEVISFWSGQAHFNLYLLMRFYLRLTTKEMNTVHWKVERVDNIIKIFLSLSGWINDFLSWSFWIPLSRLTFSTYLVHGLVIYTYYLGYPAPGRVTAMSSVGCDVYISTIGRFLFLSLCIDFSIKIE